MMFGRWLLLLLWMNGRLLRGMRILLMLLLLLWLNVNFGRPRKPFGKQGRPSSTERRVRSGDGRGPVSHQLVDQHTGIGSGCFRLGILLLCMGSIRGLRNWCLRLWLEQKSKPRSRAHEAVVARKQLIFVLPGRVIQINHILAWLMVDFNEVTESIRQNGEIISRCWMAIAHPVRITGCIRMIVTVGSSWNGTILCDKLLLVLVLRWMTVFRCPESIVLLIPGAGHACFTSLFTLATEKPQSTISATNYVYFLLF